MVATSPARHFTRLDFTAGLDGRDLEGTAAFGQRAGHVHPAVEVPCPTLGLSGAIDANRAGIDIGLDPEHANAASARDGRLADSAHRGLRLPVPDIHVEIFATVGRLHPRFRVPRPPIRSVRRPPLDY